MLLSLLSSSSDPTQTALAHLSGMSSACPDLAPVYDKLLDFRDSDPYLGLHFGLFRNCSLFPRHFFWILFYSTRLTKASNLSLRSLPKMILNMSHALCNHISLCFLILRNTHKTSQHSTTTLNH
jgi:hypothetical protein